MEYKVFELDYTTKILVPLTFVGEFVGILMSCKKITGYPATKSEPIEFAIKVVDPQMDEELTEREKKLIADRDEKQKYWLDYAARNTELTAKIKGLEDQLAEGAKTGE